jgi:hypothetical protein
VRLVGLQRQIHCAHGIVGSHGTHAEGAELGGHEVRGRAHAEPAPRGPRDAGGPVALVAAVLGERIEERVRTRVGALSGEAREIAAGREQHQPVEPAGWKDVMQIQGAVDLRSHRRREVLGGGVHQQRTGFHASRMHNTPHRREVA